VRVTEIKEESKSIMEPLSSESSCEEI
jgi:hypothetical protein